MPFLALLGACAEKATPQELPEPAEQTKACTAGGRLDVETFGAIKSDIAWQEPDIQCEGMRRPGGKGARLRFSGEVDAAGNARSLAFILSIPDLEQGAAANELATRVTLIEEENSRFFSTGDTAMCWSDITEQSPISDPDGTAIEHFYKISGFTYCVAPIAELKGTASVTLSDLRFTGQLNWKWQEQ